jgi:MFS family permease
MLAAFASGVTQIVTYGAGNFSILFLQREKGMTLSQVAVWYALLVLVCMGGGMFLSGRAIDYFARRSKQAYALLPALSLLAATPLFVGFTWAHDWPQALMFLAGPMALNYFYLSASVALVQEEVRPDQRVLSGALLLLVMNLIGIGVGPTFVGAVSDAFRPEHPHNSLQLAFLCLTPFYALAILLFVVLAGVLRREGDKSGATI